jgi:hypothetical protein
MHCFRNCLLPTEGLQQLYEVHVDVDKGLIVDILLYSKDDNAKTMILDERFDEVFDCKGNILAPGFIDIQREYGIKSPFIFCLGQADYFRQQCFLTGYDCDVKNVDSQWCLWDRFF